MERKKIKNIEQQYTLIHDGHSYSSESFPTLKAAKKRQKTFLKIKNGYPCRIIKETIVRQEIFGTYLMPKT